jgi:hypothetical protein
VSRHAEFRVNKTMLHCTSQYRFLQGFLIHHAVLKLYAYALLSKILFSIQGSTLKPLPNCTTFICIVIGTKERNVLIY